MKKIFTFLFLFSCVSLSFISCKDDDDETFVTDESLAKEMVLGGWTVTSMNIKSNFPSYDDAYNKVSVETLKSYDVTMTFMKDGIIETITNPRGNDGGKLAYRERDSYYFQNNKLYIEDSNYGMTLEHTYKVSEKSFILTGKLTKADIVKILEIDAEASGLNYTEIMNAIPSNFSGNINYTLKR